MHGTAAVEIMELKHDASPAEDQKRELSCPIVHLEDSSVSLQDGQYDPSPADSIMSNTEDQSEEATDISIQEQAVDTMQDLMEEPDGTPEASTKNIERSAPADADEPILKPNPDPEQTVLDESDGAVQCGVSHKDEPPHEDQKTEATVDKLSGGSTNDGDSLLGASRKEPDIQESHPNLAEEADDTRDENEIVLPELDSYELSCAHEGGITGHERSETEVSSESQTDVQKDNADVAVSETDACTETLKEAPVDSSAEDVGVQVSVTEKCTEMLENSAEDVGVEMSMTEKRTEMPEDAQVGALGANPAQDVGVQVPVTEKCSEDASVRAAGANAAEEEAHNLKEDVAVQMVSKASEEALSAAATPDLGLKDSDEKKLAEENKQLKELLQKLLASGNDQMGVITDLSQKVKALERKLARKKRPKVRVHRPSGHAMAKVH